MHLSTIFPFLIASLTTSLAPTAHLFANPPPGASSSRRIPTIHESAIQARRILHLSSIATLSTIFPGPETTERRPDSVAGAPIGLMDYYAACWPRPFDPTILAIGIATSFKNAATGSNVTLSLRYHPPTDRPPAKSIYTYSPANLPRFSLMGYLEAIPEADASVYNVSGCFLERHRDARPWLPANRIHESWWSRLVVTEVYWIGGFGDRNFIGWISLAEWRGVTQAEVEACRLVGEKGWKEGENGGDAEGRWDLEL